eukprot:179312-Chlamydomonas_euryale.AAC.1
MSFMMLLAEMNLRHFALKPANGLHHNMLPGTLDHYITQAHRKAIFMLLDSIEYAPVKHYLYRQYESRKMELWEMLEHLK